MMMKRFSLSLLAGLLVVFGAGAQPFDATKCYTIATPEGLVLDAQSSVQTETTMVLATPEADNPSQVWQITPLGSDLFRLVNGSTSFGSCPGTGTAHIVSCPRLRAWPWV